MTRPWIEPWCPRPLANTLPTRPMSQFNILAVTTINTSVSQKFGNILVHTSLPWICHVTKHFKMWKVLAVVGSIMVIDVLSNCALLHTMCDLKATQMNIQCSLIKNLMLYKFESGYNATEATKNMSKKWRHSWSQYSNQMVQEILLRLQVTQWSSKVR